MNHSSYRELSSLTSDQASNESLDKSENLIDSQNQSLDEEIVDEDQHTIIEGEGEGLEEQQEEEVDGEGHHKQKYTSNDPEFFMFILIATVLVVFAGICSGLTVGYLGITSLQLNIILRNGTESEKEAARAIQPLIKNHHLLLSTLLLSNAIAMEALPIFLDAICPAWAAILISTVAVVIVGEIIPQAYCTGKNQLKIGKFFAPLTKLLMKLLYIFVYPVSYLLDKMLGVHDSSRLESKEDIVGLVELQQINHQHSQQQHPSTFDSQRGLTDEEIKLVTNTMSLREKNVTKHMQPYAKIYKLPENEIVNQKLLEQIARKGYSNIVIHEVDNKSKVVGILKGKSLIDCVDVEINRSIKDVAKYQEPILISDQTNMLELMMIFQIKKSTVALVYQTSQQQISENVLDNLQDPKIQERLAQPSEFKGFILGLISLKDVFEVMINKDLHDQDSHQQDPYYQVIKTLGPVRIQKRPNQPRAQFSSIRRNY